MDIGSKDPSPQVTVYKIVYIRAEIRLDAVGNL